ncbi:MAG: hypothetical protein PHY43_00135 [Verrucomicrobiales bacterium]|nr:hypothetical protein [Verrucomicrobiales bacterium]
MLGGYEICKALLFAGAAIVLSGCIGLAVGSYGKHERLDTSFALTQGKNNFGGSVPSEAYSEPEILSLWGEPDRITTNKCCRVLSYRNDCSWSGVGAFVIIIPVPLLVPSGHYENRFYLKDGKCVGLVSEYGEVSQVYGFMWADNGGGFVAGDAPNGSRKIPLDFCK